MYSTCNIHTDSKCITCSNAFTSKHDIVINVHESHYSASASSFINHSLNPAQRLFCGGTQRNTAKRLYTGTQYVVVVTGHINKMLSETHTWGYITVQGITRCAWCSCSPLACTRMIWAPVCTKSSARLLQKIVQGDSFWTTEDAVPPWPRLDVCRPRLVRNLNSQRLLCLRFPGGKIRQPSRWSKGTVSGSVLFSGQRGCIDQEDDVLFLPLPPCCSMQSHKYTRGKRKTFNHLLVSLSAIAQDKTKAIKTEFRNCT